MTTEELFAQMEAQAANEKEYCVIDPITREISVPEVYKKIGVVSDEKTNRIYFQCPRIVGDNVDLTKYGIRVNYQNANGQTKPYPVDDVAVSGDNITFSWLLERPVTTYKGTINFVVCAIKTSGDEITNEWNTTLAQSEVLEGLEPDISITEDEESIVELLVAQCTQKLTEMNMAIQNSENATNNAKTATQEAVNATEDARSVIEQITKDSYLHTALETFINEVTAKPTAYGNALVEKIEGYIRQNQPKGYQLFDSSSLTAYNEATFSVLNGGKDVKVTGRKTSESAKSSVIYQIKSALFELMKGKTLYVYVNHDAENGWFEFGIQSESTGWTYKQVTNKQWTEVNVPSDLKNTSIALIPNAKTEENITATFKDIKIGLSQFEEWEPYTGGEPSPSPDYPQVIHGVGDMGFFDGELIVGSYSDSTGALVPQNNNYVSSVDFIPCKANDSINLIYETQFRAAWILFYKKDGTFISSESALSSQNITVKAPSDSYYFRFSISESSAVANVSSAKHITVTINGMYAICVKTVGKNLADLKSLFERNGGNYGEISYITAEKANNLVIYRNFKKKSGSLTISYDVKDSSSNAGVSVRIYYTDGTKEDMEYGSTNWVTRKKTTNPGKVIDYIGFIVAYGYTVTYFKNFIICSESPTDYIPYQGNTTYIPISSPLFAGDQLIKRNMEHKTYRKMGFAIFDGSEDEVWTEQNTEYGKCFYSRLNDAVRYKVYPDSFAKNNILQFYKNGYLSMPIYSFTFYTGELSDYKGENWIYIRLADDITSVQQAKDYLKNHNMIVVYELATPTEEDLTPEAQKAIHSIMACDEQTTIEIAGVPTDAEVQNQFLLPRNVDGALNTTAYATSKRNEITLSEQAQQLSQVVTQAITLAKAQEV